MNVETQSFVEYLKRLGLVDAKEGAERLQYIVELSLKEEEKNDAEIKMELVLKSAMYSYLITLNQNESYGIAKNLVQLWREDQRNSCHIMKTESRRRLNDISGIYRSGGLSKANLTDRTRSEDTMYISNSIHERLHEEARQKAMDQARNEKIKEELELKNCSFKPQISQSAAQKPVPPIKEFFSSLARPKENTDEIEAKKNQFELRDCTFKPQIQRSGHLSSRANMTTTLDAVSDNNKTQDDEEVVFERLYKAGKQRDEYIEALKEVKEKKEVEGCTFVPQVNRGAQPENTKSSSKIEEDVSSPDPFSRLYQDNQRREKDREDKKKVQDALETSLCTFNPDRPTKKKDGKFAAALERYKSKERFDEIQRAGTSANKEKDSPIHPTPGSTPNHCKDTKRSNNVSLSRDYNQFERLYSKRLEYQENKHKLSQKLFHEQGVSFKPDLSKTARRADSSMRDDGDTKSGVWKRTEEFLRRREEKVNKMKEEELKHTTFSPTIYTKQQPVNKGLRESLSTGSLNPEKRSERLHKKAAELEKKREASRQRMAAESEFSFKPQINPRTKSGASGNQNYSPKGDLTSKASFFGGKNRTSRRNFNHLHTAAATTTESSKILKEVN